MVLFWCDGARALREDLCRCCRNRVHPSICEDDWRFPGKKKGRDASFGTTRSRAQNSRPDSREKVSTAEQLSEEPQDAQAPKHQHRRHDQAYKDLGTTALAVPPLWAERFARNPYAWIRLYFIPSGAAPATRAGQQLNEKATAVHAVIH